MFQILMGVLRLGFVTIYLADPLISGFTTGAACHVFTSQVKYVLGIKVQRYNGALKLIKVIKCSNVNSHVIWTLNLHYSKFINFNI